MIEEHQKKVEDIFTSISITLTEEGDIPALYILMFDDNTITPILIEDGLDVTLNEYGIYAVSKAREERADALIYINKASVVKIDNKNENEITSMYTGVLKPSEHPNKEDMITIIYMACDGECKILLSKIHKDLRGTPFTRDFKWVDGQKNMIQPWK